MNRFFDPDATRIAMVHPISGAILSTGGSADPEATTLLSGARMPGPSQVPTETYIPMEGHRPTGEVTTRWETPKTGFGRVVRRRIADIPRWVFILAGTLIAAVTLFFMVSSEDGFLSDADNSRGTEGSTSADPQVAAARADDSSDARAESLEGSVSEAVDALLNGRLGEAEARYRSLSRRFPERLEFSEALRILKRREGAKERP